MSTLMGTASRKIIDLANFRPEDVDIRDVAHALAHLCRFNGHSPVHYSVAQHSCHVANVVRRTHPELELLALVHDAQEAYIGDLIRPLKALVPAVQEIEDRIGAVVWSALCGREIKTLPAAIKAADDAVLHTELRMLFDVPVKDSQKAIANAKLDCWSIRWAQSRFLKRFEELKERSSRS